MAAIDMAKYDALKALNAEELLTAWQKGDDTAAIRLGELVIRTRHIAESTLKKTMTGKRALVVLDEVGFDVTYDALDGDFKCQISNKKATWRAKANDKEYYLSEAWYFFMRDYVLAKTTPHIIGREDNDVRKALDCPRFAQRLKLMAERLLQPPITNAKYNHAHTGADHLLTKFT